MDIDNVNRYDGRRKLPVNEAERSGYRVKRSAFPISTCLWTDLPEGTVVYIRV